MAAMETETRVWKVILDKEFNYDTYTYGYDYDDASRAQFKCDLENKIEQDGNRREEARRAFWSEMDARLLPPVGGK